MRGATCQIATALGNCASRLLKNADLGNEHALRRSNERQRADATRVHPDDGDLDS
jgi:hypothetical protein